MSGFLNYPGYSNVFSCVSCEVSRSDFKDSDPEEFQCAGCLSYICKHLMLTDSDGHLCFCCRGYPENQNDWPDWCFTMIPGDRKKGGVDVK